MQAAGDAALILRKGIGTNSPPTFLDNPQMAFPSASRGPHSGDTPSKGYKQY